MRHYSQIALVGAVCMLLAACTNDDVLQEGQVASFKLATEKQTVSRAAANLNDQATFVFPSDFTIAMDAENFTYTANGIETEMTSSEPARFPIDGSNVRIIAFYPSFAMSYSDTPQTFTVAQDQSQTDMGANNYRVSDLMYGLPQSTFSELDTDGKVKCTAQPIPLVFEHKMSKISINVHLNGSVIKKMTMLNVKRSIDFNPADATFSNLAEAADELGNSILVYESEVGMLVDTECAVLVPTQSLAVGTKFIEIVVEDFPNDQVLTYRLHEDADFQPGAHYIYQLQVTMSGVEDVQCTMAPWDTNPPGWTDINETITL